MSEKTCRKCGHTTTYSGLEPQSCPECGAIYAKVEEALRAASSARASRVAAGPQDARPSRLPGARGYASGVDVHSFAAQMRSDSLYPMWRKLIGIATMMGYLLAALMLIGSLIALFNASVTAGLVGAAAAVFVAIMVRVAKEAWLMLADLSDASVRLAAWRESD